MPARIIPGYHFGQNEQVSPAKLNRILDLAQIVDIPIADVVPATSKELVYGGSTPALERGRIHYDITPGFEGLKWAFISASFASISRWLYRTPHLDGIFWADSGATYGLPQYIAGHVAWTGCFFKLYDGCIFPRVLPAEPASDPIVPHNLGMVIPLESRTSPGPIAAAVRGIVPGVWLGTAASNGMVYSSSYTPTGFNAVVDTIPVNQSAIFGVLSAPPGGVPGITLPSWLYWGTALQDSKP